MKSKTLAIIGVVVVVVVMFGITSTLLADSARPETAPPRRIASDATSAQSVNSRVSYQGHLTNPGTDAPLNGNYDMVFQFWNAGTSGSQVGSDLTVNNVTVVDGLFNVELDVPQNTFNGQGLWLRVSVENEWLTPRTELLPAPYALGLRPGAVIIGDVSVSAIVSATNQGDGSGLVWF